VDALALAFVRDCRHQFRDCCAFGGLEGASRSNLSVRGVWCEALFLCMEDEYDWLSYSVLRWRVGIPNQQQIPVLGGLRQTIWG